MDRKRYRNFDPDNGKSAHLGFRPDDIIEKTLGTNQIEETQTQNLFQQAKKLITIY